MNKRSILGKSILCALLFPGAVMAEGEVTGYIKNETAVFTVDGQLIGSKNNTYDDVTGVERGDLMKVESSARIFINGQLGEDSSWHADLNFVYDTQGINRDYRGHQSYTQHDWLRELYVDTTIGDWYLRLGKQQVVWGTADGIKLLDIINPTDWREFTQNTMAESRIPIWMINAERDIGDTGNIQLIISQAKENRIAGLNADGDQGHPFLMKGVETITGEVNGFLSIIPKLTGVATSFTMAAGAGVFQMPDGQGGVIPIYSGMQGWGASPEGITMPGGLVPFGTMMSVEGFAGQEWDTSNGGALLNPAGAIVLTDEQRAMDYAQNIMNPATGITNGYTLLNGIAQQGLMGMFGAPDDPYANNGETAVMNESGSAWVLDPVNQPSMTTVSWDIQNPTSAFEYMPNASFATFNNSSGNQWLIDALQQQGIDPSTVLDTSKLHGPSQSQYVRDYPNSEEPNFGMRYKGSMENGLNFSLNYFYGYDSNPYVNMECRDTVTGEALQHTLIRPGESATLADGSPNPDFNYAYTSYSREFNDATEVSESEVGNTFDGTMGVAYNAAGQYYGAFNPMTGGLAASLANPDEGHSTNGITMTFVESLNRTQNIGTSFDYALDTSFAPIVLRGEFLYKKDEMQPVIDKRLMGIGYLPEAMVSEEHDVFKYVLGADINVFTNMMVSAQFIQFMNLDYIDEQRTCTTQLGTTYDCSRYTADMPTLSLSNGLNKAEENKEFYSLFLSKPFGASQEHRWNNIIMFEENGGYWNRFDVEYSFTDSLIGTMEVNHYWGDENTMFGQFHDSSNLQLGIKYLFD